MSDKYIALNSFKYGLDGRRDVLSAVPGTLAQLINAHINAGGEIEQRMSFAKNATSFPSDTFGLQDTDSGLVTFGSDASPSGSLPSGVTYQRLQHPTGWTSVPGNAASMNALIFSCNFLGKAFAIAGFNDGRVFAYYNGVLVGPSRNGYILGEVGGPEAVNDLANDLAGQIGLMGSGWSASPNQVVIGGVGVVKLGGVIWNSPPSIHFTPVPIVSSTSGLLSATLVDQNNPGTAARAASVAFTLNAGTTGTVTLTQGTTQVSGGAIAFDTSLSQTAVDIVNAVNLFTSATGYSAVKTGTATITVYAPTSLGNFSGNLTVVTTGDITTVTATVANAFSLTVSPSTLDIVKVIPAPSRIAVVSGVINVSTSGAIGAVTYAWSEVAADGVTPAAGSSGISMSNTSASTITFSASMSVQTTRTGYFLCTATDIGGASGSPAKRVITVTLELTNNL